MLPCVCKLRPDELTSGTSNMIAHLAAHAPHGPRTSDTAICGAGRSGYRNYVWYLLADFLTSPAKCGDTLCGKCLELSDLRVLAELNI